MSSKKVMKVHIYRYVVLEHPKSHALIMIIFGNSIPYKIKLYQHVKSSKSGLAAADIPFRLGILGSITVRLLYPSNALEMSIFRYKTLVSLVSSVSVVGKNQHTAMFQVVSLKASLASPPTWADRDHTVPANS